MNVLRNRKAEEILPKLSELSIPPAPQLEPRRLPPAPPPVPPETEAEVLARYGKSLTETPKVIFAAADVTRMTAEKLIEESAAGIEAARGILKMLEEEHATYSSEIRRHSENYALRLTEYLTRCHIAIQSMARHREAIIEVSQVEHREPEHREEAPAPAPANDEKPEGADQD